MQRAAQQPTRSGLASFLAGVRVIDLSQYIPGPMATLFLADMGAEVLKVEPPQGDAMQTLGPRDADGQPIFYDALNAGKSVCRLDLKEDEGRRAFLELVKDADVVIEGFRTGVLTRLGIDYAVMKSVNPAIILCSLSGYGCGSTRAKEAGHDANYLALTGVLHRNGGDPPMYFDPPVSDVAGALFAAMTILGALHRQAATGKGCVIDLALADTIMPAQLMQVADYGANGTVPAPRSTYLNGGAAYYQVYATGDRRHIALGAVEAKFWMNFCQAAGRDDWIGRQDEPLPQITLTSDLAAFFGGLTAAAVAAQFEGVDCCLSPVNDLAAAMGEQHVADRRLVRRSEEGDLQSLYPAWIDGASPGLRARAEILSVPHWPQAAGAGTERKTSLSEGPGRAV